MCEQLTNLEDNPHVGPIAALSRNFCLYVKPGVVVPTATHSLLPLMTAVHTSPKPENDVDALCMYMICVRVLSVLVHAHDLCQCL